MEHQIQQPFNGVDDVLEAAYRNSSSVDFPLTKISRSEYQ